jgi:glycosyltransferase involved in cell wall biosynthesis
VPVVVTAAGGTPEIVRHKETGWCTPVGDVKGLAEGLLHVKSHPDEAEIWASTARCMVENEFSLDHMVARTQDLYDEFARRRT